MPGESQETPQTPPDPSVMATEAVTRALAGMRDYVDGEVEAINQRIEGLDRLLGYRFDDLRSLLDERYTTQTKGLEVAFAAAEKAVSAALESAEKAVTKAELAADKRFECVSADTPVLCADLIWRPAGDLLVGDELIAFDEKGPTRSGRRFRRSVVTDNSITRDALLLVTTSEGAVRCNRHHPWLARRARDRGWSWIEAADLGAGFQVAHPLDVWENDRSWEAGWLAGMFDGEGCLSVGKGQVQLTLSQRESPTSDMIARVLKERLGKEPLTYRYEPGTPSTPQNTQPFFHFMVASRYDIMKLLGSTRPPRLLVKSDGVWEGRVIAGNGRIATVESVESAGSGLIARLSTSTHTYIADGFAMHNSVNEFRAQLADQAATLMARSEAEIRFASLGEKVETMAGVSATRISELEKRANVGSGETAGMAGSNVTRRADVVMITAVVGVLVAIGSLVAVILIATGK